MFSATLSQQLHKYVEFMCLIRNYYIDDIKTVNYGKPFCIIAIHRFIHNHHIHDTNNIIRALILFEKVEYSD